VSAMSGTFQRTDRVADLMRRDIAEVLLREVKDPRVRFVTITDVRLSKDLRNARVFFTTLLQDGQLLEDVMEGLRHAAGFVQRKVGGRLQLRCTPHITFAYDSSFENGAKMDRILRGIEDELASVKEKE
jgi:ribosome-binding factor A